MMFNALDIYWVSSLLQTLNGTYGYNPLLKNVERYHYSSRKHLAGYISNSFTQSCGGGGNLFSILQPFLKDAAFQTCRYSIAINLAKTIILQFYQLRLLLIGNTILFPWSRITFISSVLHVIKSFLTGRSLKVFEAQMINTGFPKISLYSTYIIYVRVYPDHLWIHILMIQWYGCTSRTLDYQSLADIFYSAQSGKPGESHSVSRKAKQLCSILTERISPYHEKRVFFQSPCSLSAYWNLSHAQTLS